MSYNLLMIGDSNLFHASFPGGSCGSSYLDSASVASMIRKRFKERRGDSVEYHPVHEFLKRPVFYPQYSCLLGQSAEVRLGEMKELMNQISDDSVALIWLGQHDAWYMSKNMPGSLAKSCSCIEELAAKFSQRVNELDFAVVIYVSYFDHSSSSACSFYQELSQALLAALLSNTCRSKLLDVGEFDDQCFVDLVHLGVTHKRRLSSRILDALGAIMNEHMCSPALVVDT